VTIGYIGITCTLFPVLYKTSSLALPDPSLTLKGWWYEAGENKHR